MAQLPNYLISYRKRSALSQTEVAFLLGVRGGAKVSRHERFARDPGLRAALVYQAIYQKPVSELFPGMFKEIQREVRARAKVLNFRTFAGNAPPIVAKKRKTLAAIAPGQITNQSKQS